jgi:hypothetical protein
MARLSASAKFPCRLSASSVAERGVFLPMRGVILPFRPDRSIPCIGMADTEIRDADYRQEKLIPGESLLSMHGRKELSGQLWTW